MKQVLIVEDDEFISDLVAEKLHQQKITVEVLSSGRAALTFVKQHKPDLIILDLEIKELQGIDLLHELKKLDHAPPVIVFSNNDDPTVKEQCKQLGVRAFYVKVNTALDVLVEETLKQFS